MQFSEWIDETARDLRDEGSPHPVQDARILAYELGSRCERDEVPPPNLSELETIKTKVKRGRRAAREIVLVIERAPPVTRRHLNSLLEAARNIGRLPRPKGT